MKALGINRFSGKARLGLSLAAVAAFAVACGSSSSGSASSSPSSKAPSSATGASAKKSSSSSAMAETIMAKSGPLGTYLTDGSGKTLYLWVADKDGKSSCTGSCAAAWPPATAMNTPKAGSGVKASELSTTTRSGGVKQITYDGHPLYYYIGDKAAGDTSGQGSDGFGAKWWLVGPDGKQITKTASSSGSTSSGSSTTSSSSSSSSSGSDAGGGWS
jgi:predicted lipoprotein with Yx(FWY)xxD motif